MITADTTTNRPRLIVIPSHHLIMSAQPIPSAPRTPELVAVMDTPLAMKSPADHRGRLTVTTLLAHRTDSRLAIVITTARRRALMVETVNRGLAQPQRETTLAAATRPAVAMDTLLAMLKSPDQLGRLTVITLLAHRIRRPLIRAVDTLATIRLLIRQPVDTRRMIGTTLLPAVDMDSPEIATLIRLQAAATPEFAEATTLTTAPTLTLAHRTSPPRTATEPGEKSPHCLPPSTWPLMMKVPSFHLS